MPAPDYLAATNVGDAVVGSSVIDFDHYWHLKQLYRNGDGVAYPSIKAAGCSWRFHYYPNGVSSSCKDYVSIFVALDSRLSQPIKAWSRFTLVDQNAEPVPGHSVYTDVMESSEVGATHGCDLFIRRKFLEASKHLHNGCFHIIWDVFVDWPPPLSDLLDTDVVFQVAGEEFSANRSVLASRSPVFQAELFSATREDGPAAGDCIRIDDMLPEVFESLLYFAYEDSLPEMIDLEESMMAEQLLLAADRFDMQELKRICEEMLCSYINEDTVAKMLRFAEQHYCRLLRDACIEFLEDPTVLQAVMAADDDLLEVVANSCPVLLKELWVDEDDSMQDELAMCFTVSEEIC
ncbi:unnamed protein product [Urochloa decumbens]|uniref:BTB domain-containing protein n=1 Tax=Urochloa decumbens TaxID=240449 RepID=A0ABC8YE07_9POAL